MNKNEKFVITINRELGSGGRTVGRILAEKLGVPYYDKALIKAFGSLKAIREADEEALRKVPGMTEAAAQAEAKTAPTRWKLQKE